MTIRPARAGKATHNAVSISGAARCSVFCQENQSPNAPLNRIVQVSTGLAPPSQTKPPKSSSAAASAPTGKQTSRAFTASRRSRRRSGRADHPFDEVAHLLELDVGLLDRLAGGDDGGALVVPQAGGAAREDVEGAGEHLRLDVLGVL